MVLYVAYLPHKLHMNTPVKVYSIMQQTEINTTFQKLLNVFPPPPPFAMWGTPTGHLFHYNCDLKWTHSLDEYKSLVNKNYLYKLLSKL